MGGKQLCPFLVLLCGAKVVCIMREKYVKLPNSQVKSTDGAFERAEIKK